MSHEADSLVDTILDLVASDEDTQSCVRIEHSGCTTEHLAGNVALVEGQTNEINPEIRRGTVVFVHGEMPKIGGIPAAVVGRIADSRAVIEIKSWCNTRCPGHYEFYVVPDQLLAYVGLIPARIDDEAADRIVAQIEADLRRIMSYQQQNQH